MGNCIDLMLDDDDCTSRVSGNSPFFFRFFKWNRVSPSFIQAALDAQSTSTSHHLPTGLWEIVVDPETKRSVISALTMDESLARLGNGMSGYDLPIMKPAPNLLIPHPSVRMTAATMSESDRAHGLRCAHEATMNDNENSETNDDNQENEDSQLKITTNAIVSYLQTVSAENPKISSLLCELHKIEESREEGKVSGSYPPSPTATRSPSIVNTCERRNEVIACLREEFRKAFTTTTDE